MIRTLVSATTIFFAGAVALAADDYPDQTPDGLTRDNAEQDVVLYWLEDSNLSAYNKVRILDCQVAFEEHWQRDFNRNVAGPGGRVSDEDMDEIKTNLAETVRAVFSEELSQKGYQVVSSVGEDVLLLRPAIMNLDVTMPHRRTPKVDLSVATSAGSMTFYMEVYDSVTVSKIGLLIDQEILQSNLTYSGGSQATTKSEVSHLMRGWVGEVIERLDNARAN
ncbi:MAG: DUF3313 family protein [Pseudomonadota bacterium]